ILAEVSKYVRDDCPLAAGLAIHAQADLDVFPFAVDPRTDPAVHLGCQVDPARAAPGAEHHLRPALSAWPYRQRRAVDRFAVPGAAHHLQHTRQHFEPRVEIRLHDIEVGLGRAGTDTEPEPSTGQQMDGLHPMSMFNRMANRHLNDAGAEFD